MCTLLIQKDVRNKFYQFQTRHAAIFRFYFKPSSGVMMTPDIELSKTNFEIDFCFDKKIVLNIKTNY